MRFRFISDPGHGWIEVPLSLVDLLGIRAKISRYSYLRGDLAYLEEDCDAAEFMQACRAQGITVEFDEVNQNSTSPIRNYSRFSA